MRSHEKGPLGLIRAQDRGFQYRDLSSSRSCQKDKQKLDCQQTFPTVLRAVGEMMHSTQPLLYRNNLRHRRVNFTVLSVVPAGRSFHTCLSWGSESSLLVAGVYVPSSILVATFPSYYACSHRIITTVSFQYFLSSCIPIMSEGDHHGPRSSSDVSHNLQELESIRRNEQWSSLDSCIIPNRIRVPSANVKSKCPQPGTEDFQVALNLLNIESKIKPPERHRSRGSSGPKRSTKAFTSIDEDPFDTRISSRDVSAASKQSSQKACSSSSGSVIVHSENLPALERLLQQHNLPHLHIGGCNEHEALSAKLHSDTEPLQRRPKSGVALSVGVAHPRNSFPHDGPEQADNCLLETEQERKASSSSETAFDAREVFYYSKEPVQKKDQTSHINANVSKRRTRP